MPELPEVESIKLQLNKYIKGHTIKEVIVNHLKSFSEGKELILGGKIEDIERFGKVIVIKLSNNYSIVVHVKMTGQLIYDGPNLKEKFNVSPKVVGGVPGKHTHVIFKLDNNGILYFNDYRKFGWIKVVNTNEVKDLAFIKNLGPEPLKDMDLKLFSNIVLKSTKPIKVLLMEQSKISGIGNIYATDALFLAGIDPRRKANTLSGSDIKKLYESINLVLEDGIKRGGASERSFVTPDGKEGNYQNFTRIYNKHGKLCPNCHTEKIIKIKLAGRGTYYCPMCQK